MVAVHIIQKGAPVHIWFLLRLFKRPLLVESLWILDQMHVLTLWGSAAHLEQQVRRVNRARAWVLARAGVKVQIFIFLAVQGSAGHERMVSGMPPPRVLSSRKRGTCKFD